MADFQRSQPKPNTSQEHCPQCQAPLRLKHVGQQSFWGCTAYPACRYTKPLHEPSDFPPEPLPGQFCPECERQLLLKKGRYGFFVGCSGFPDCQYVTDPTAPGEHQQVEQVSCPQCKDGKLQIRTNRRGKTFYACNNYPACRYLLNDPPVAEACPECGHGVLVHRRTVTGQWYRCPQRQCDYEVAVTPDSDDPVPP